MDKVVVVHARKVRDNVPTATQEGMVVIKVMVVGR